MGDVLICVRVGVNNMFDFVLVNGKTMKLACYIVCSSVVVDIVTVKIVSSETF